MRMVVAIVMSVCLGACADVRHYGAATARDGCFIGGCSSEVCSNQDGVITACYWKDHFACYHEALCEPQRDGDCGWTATPKLTACLQSYSRPAPTP